MLALLLVACAGQPDTAALEARIAELEAGRAEDAALIEQLQHRVGTLDSRLSAVELRTDPSIGVPNRPERRLSTTTAGTGPQCALDGEVYVLPEGQQDADALSRMARVVPHKGADGELDGFRLSGIRRGSTLDSCGFKNGDVVKTVSGRPVTSVDEALAAYQATQDQPELVVGLLHRGAALELRFRQPG